MGNCLTKVNTIMLIISLLLVSCKDDPGPEITNNQLLTRLWAYDFILSDADTIQALDNSSKVLDSLFAPHFEVQTRGIKYTSDQVYQYQWGFTFFQQSIGDGLNFQPNLGYWDLNADGNRLIHNSTREYEVVYNILELTEDRMVRTSQRYDELKGEWVLWTEAFSSSPNN